MNIVTIDTLKPDVFFTSDLLIDTNFVLLPQGAPVTKELLAELEEWGFKSFNCDGGISLGGSIGSKTDGKKEKQPEAESDNINEKIEKIKEAISNAKKYNLENSDKSRMDGVQNVYNEYMDYINTVYTYYVTHKKINKTALAEAVKDLIIFVKDNKKFILRITPSAETRNKNYLVAHSMRSTVLAIVIGLEQHMPLSKLVELGEACLLHEIGMVRLPPQLYMSDRKLNANERKQVMTHTLLGYEIVKNLDFPVRVQLGILEHHEKENGTGYPRRLTSEQITSYAKIIAVVCTYEAISAPRTYKDDRSTYEAMVELLKNQNNQFDPDIIKALLYTISLYPIGAYVFLKNGKVALVTDVNPDDPKLPVVQLLTEREKDGSPKIIQTNNAEYAILRVLSKEETESVKSSVEKALAKERAMRQEKASAEPSGTENADVQAPAPKETPPKAEQENKVPEKTEAKPKPKPMPLSKDEIEEIDINSFFD